MGDLIIKPASSGNLKIQDQGGTERISLNTSGVTTFASNTTFSGTGNNIGTATAGTLGSSVVFPAGHVIQAKMHTEQEDLESTNNSTATTTSSSCTLSCTSGNILCVWICGGYTYSAYASSGTQTGMTITVGGTTTQYLTGKYTSNNAIVGWVGSTFVSLSVTTTGDHVVKRAVMRESGSGTARWSTDTHLATCYWTLMEIQPTS